MNYPNSKAAVNAYTQVAVQTGVNTATPHRLIQMLMEGALEKIARAKGDMERRNVAGKAKHIGTAISIIEGLRVSLDLEAGGEIAQNLFALYDYMERRLFEANVHNNKDHLDEVSNLIKQIKSAWDAIPQELHDRPTPAPEAK
jgi:flagellar protein FliS